MFPKFKIMNLILPRDIPSQFYKRLIDLQCRKAGSPGENLIFNSDKYQGQRKHREGVKQH